MATPHWENAIGPRVLYPYLYSPIHSIPDQPVIRLLVIFAGLPQDPLLGVLVNEALDPTGNQVPFWTAVSYAWEGQRPSETLLFDDQYLPITSNVAQIIRDLREPDQHIVVWIDAVCINQNDEDEKRSQIPIMQEIYGKAKEVVIWLRPQEEVFPVNLIIVSQWLDEKRMNQDYEMTALPLAGAFQRDHPGLIWGAPFHRIAKCEWFQRIWVIQESVVAQNLWFHIKRQRFTWEFICSATLRFLSGSQMRPALEESLDQCCIRGLLQSYETRTHRTISMLRLVHRLRASSQNHAYRLAPSEVVHLCRHQKASLAADMIYGVSGLFIHYNRSTSTAPMEINYRERPFQVYQQFALWCMETEGNLDVIAQLRNEGGLSPWRAWNQGSPEQDPSSWVGVWYEGDRTNFTTSPDIDLDPMRQLAVAQIPSNIRMLRQVGNILVLKGFIIDTFKNVPFQVHRDSTKDHLNWLEHILHDPKANLVLFGEEQPSAETLKKKLRRTLEREPVCSHLWRDGQLPTPPRQGIDGDWRTAVLTSRGCLAITYPYISEEAVICALYGARALFVLAPKKQQSSGRSLYTLVSGDCFIDEFEDGKGIEMARKLGLREEEIEIA